MNESHERVLTIFSKNMSSINTSAVNRNTNNNQILNGGRGRQREENNENTHDGVRVPPTNRQRTNQLQPLDDSLLNMRIFHNTRVPPLSPISLAKLEQQDIEESFENGLNNSYIDV